MAVPCPTRLCPAFKRWEGLGAMPLLAGSQYEAVMASGLVRDGMALELVDASGEPVAEVFCSDATAEMTFSAYRRGGY
jgi:hypothetical protein